LRELRRVVPGGHGRRRFCEFDDGLAHVRLRRDILPRLRGALRRLQDGGLQRVLGNALGYGGRAMSDLRAADVHGSHGTAEGGITMSDIIRFETNVPVTVTLRYPEGKEVDGRFGPQVMFSTDDGRLFFVDPPVAARIHALRLRGGEEFVIVKRSVKDGRKS